MSKWALILGASTGHGGATAISLAEKGYGIIGFHFDRGETKKEAEKTISKVNELNGGLCHYWNTNAASEQAMDKYIPEIKKIVGDGHLKLFLHSIAFGTTTNFFGETPVTQRQMDMTVHVMGNSLLYWTQKLFEQKLIGLMIMSGILFQVILEFFSKGAEHGHIPVSYTHLRAHET